MTIGLAGVVSIVVLDDNVPKRYGIPIIIIFGLLAVVGVTMSIALQ